MTRRWWLLVLPVLAVLLSSCLTVPTSGPVQAGHAPSQAPSGPVEIEPEPPVRDAPAALVVEGFLHAMANYRTDYAVAREYLAEDVRESWRPDQAVLVYGEGSPVGSGSSVVLEAPLVGVVGADGSYSQQDRDYRIDFQMELDADGQWRIGHPPEGLLVSQYLFERFYDGLNVYFFDPDFAGVVPDPIYVPRGNQSATTLVNALLDGPTRWLAPAVVSAVPEQAELGLSIPISPEGVAEVSLDETVDQLTAEQRNRMAAQVVWTLRQLEEITAIRFLSAGSPYVVPGQRDDGTVGIGAYDYLSPLAGSGDPQLLVAEGEGISRVRDGLAATPELVPVEGPLGDLGEPVAAMAVAPSPDQELAVVSADRRRLLVADSLPGATVEEPLVDAEGLLTPQYTRLHDLWVLQSGADGTRVHVVDEGGPHEVDAPALAGKEVVSFRISPDGTRMAVAHRVDGRVELAMALVRRGDQPSVTSLRSIPLVSATGRLSLVDAVSWSDDTSLLLLARAGTDSPSLPWVVDQDGAEMTQVGSGGWDPVALAAFPHPGGPRAAVVGREGQLWVRQGDYRWPEVLGGVGAAAFAG